MINVFSVTALLAVLALGVGVHEAQATHNSHREDTRYQNRYNYPSAQPHPDKPYKNYWDTGKPRRVRFDYPGSQYNTYRSSYPQRSYAAGYYNTGYYNGQYPTYNPQQRYLERYYNNYFGTYQNY